MFMGRLSIFAFSVIMGSTMIAASVPIKARTLAVNFTANVGQLSSKGANPISALITYDGTPVNQANRNQPLAFSVRLATDDYLEILPQYCEYSDSPQMGSGDLLAFITNGCPVEIMRNEYGIIQDWHDYDQTTYNVTWLAFRFESSNQIYIHCTIWLCIDQIDCNPYRNGRCSASNNWNNSTSVSSDVKSKAAIKNTPIHGNKWNSRNVQSENLNLFSGTNTINYITVF